jgi:hypothetical protein
MMVDPKKERDLEALEALEDEAERTYDIMSDPNSSEDEAFWAYEDHVRATQALGEIESRLRLPSDGETKKGLASPKDDQPEV